jgi:DeoR family ulaG and ulaABCDEF operon transcriptional repressor
MFMSCFSFGPLGVIEGDPLIARAEAKLLGRADKLVVLADSSKFETRGNMAVCPLTRVHTLITDDKAPESVLDHVRRAGVNVVFVRGGASIFRRIGGENEFKPDGKCHSHRNRRTHEKTTRRQI